MVNGHITFTASGGAQERAYAELDKAFNQRLTDFLKTAGMNDCAEFLRTLNDAEITGTDAAMALIAFAYAR